MVAGDVRAGRLDTDGVYAAIEGAEIAEINAFLAESRMQVSEQDGIR